MFPRGGLSSPPLPARRGAGAGHSVISAPAPPSPLSPPLPSPRRRSLHLAGHRRRNSTGFLPRAGDAAPGPRRRRRRRRSGGCGRRRVLCASRRASAAGWLGGWVRSPAAGLHNGSRSVGWILPWLLFCGSTHPPSSQVPGYGFLSGDLPAAFCRCLW